MNKKTIRSSIVLFVAVLQLSPLTPSRAESASDEELLAVAISAHASQIESGLPDQPIESWLKSLVGEDVSWTWGLNDCGEQTGVPEIDRDRDMPICAEITATDDDRAIFLYFLVGTSLTGVAESSEFHTAAISESDSLTAFDSLCSFVAYLQDNPN